MICQTKWSKKSEFGSSLPIIELPPAQQQQVQFRCTKLGDVVEYNAKLIPKLNTIPLCVCGVIYCNIDWRFRVTKPSPNLLGQQLVTSLVKFLASDLSFPNFYNIHSEQRHFGRNTCSVSSDQLIFTRSDILCKIDLCVRHGNILTSKSFVFDIWWRRHTIFYLLWLFYSALACPALEV